MLTETCLSLTPSSRCSSWHIPERAVLPLFCLDLHARSALHPLLPYNLPWSHGQSIPTCTQHTADKCMFSSCEKCILWPIKVTPYINWIQLLSPNAGKSARLRNIKVTRSLQTSLADPALTLPAVRNLPGCAPWAAPSGPRARGEVPASWAAWHGVLWWGGWPWISLTGKRNFSRFHLKHGAHL